MTVLSFMSGEKSSPIFSLYKLHAESVLHGTMTGYMGTFQGTLLQLLTHHNSQAIFTLLSLPLPYHSKQLKRKRAWPNERGHQNQIPKPGSRRQSRTSCYLTWPAPMTIPKLTITSCYVGRRRTGSRRAFSNLGKQNGCALVLSFRPESHPLLSRSLASNGW